MKTITRLTRRVGTTFVLVIVIGTLLWRGGYAAGAAVIVDNTDPGFTVAGGEWGSCQNGDCQGACYGPDFRFAEPGCTDCRAQFVLRAPADGDYDVWTWWPWGDDRAVDTLFAVQHGTTSLDINVDQRNSGDAWWWLATLSLAAQEEVTISVTGSASGYAVADAVAITTVGSGDPGNQPQAAPPSAATSPEASAGAGMPVIQYFYSEPAPRQGCYYLHWDVSDATTVYLDGEVVENPGSSEVCATGTTSHTLNAVNGAGSTDQVLSVNASEAPEPSETEISEPAAGSAVTPVTTAIIVDHTSTDLSRIPRQWIEQARRLTLHYAHTSHGEQILAGLAMLEEIDPVYNVAVRNLDPAGLPDEVDALRIYDGNNYPGDNYITPEMYWNDPDGQQHTRSVAGTALFSLSMWTWCGQQSENSPDDVERYLAALQQFEADYPGMRFVYATGHSDGTTDSTLARNNQAVRDYARTHGKVLFDFEAIETHDPAGNYYANDAEGQCAWCDNWCAAHPDDCTRLPAWCPHSESSEAQKLNCKLKANAFWWMMARLAGWDGVPQ